MDMQPLHAQYKKNLIPYYTLAVDNFTSKQTPLSNGCSLCSKV